MLKLEADLHDLQYYQRIGNVGLGGFGVPQLIQAGTQENASISWYGSVQTNYYVWWQM